MNRPGSSSTADEGTAAPRRRRLVQDRRVLFLAVGAFNTAFGTAAFVVLQLLLGDRLHYLGVLLLAHVVSVLVAFVLHRSIVFQVTGTGSVLLDLVRFESVYLGALAVNVVALPLLVEVGGLPVIGAQLVVTALVVAGTFFAHKNFSFRRPGGAP